MCQRHHLRHLPAPQQGNHPLCQALDSRITSCVHCAIIKHNSQLSATGYRRDTRWALTSIILHSRKQHQMIKQHVLLRSIECWPEPRMCTIEVMMQYAMWTREEAGTLVSGGVPAMSSSSLPRGASAVCSKDLVPLTISTRSRQLRDNRSLKFCYFIGDMQIHSQESATITSKYALGDIKQTKQGWSVQSANKST